MTLPPRISRSVFKPPKKKRAGDSKAHRRFVASLPCCVCGSPAYEAHHLTGNVDGLPKSGSMKNEDRYTVPLCRKHHDLAHNRGLHHRGNSETWLAELGIDARALASALWRVSGDEEAGYRIVSRAKRAA